MKEFTVRVSRNYTVNKSWELAVVAENREEARDKAYEMAFNEGHPCDAGPEEPDSDYEIIVEAEAAK